MTHKTALYKLDHAIDHLKESAGRMPPMMVWDGKVVETIPGHRQIADHHAMSILGRAMCDVVREMRP